MFFVELAHNRFSFPRPSAKKSKNNKDQCQKKKKNEERKRETERSVSILEWNQIPRALPGGERASLVPDAAELSTVRAKNFV